MRPTVSPARRFFALVAGLPVAVTIFSPLAPEAFAIQPRAERVANRVAERRYARMSIAEARVARAEARVAEIAPAVPVPPPRPATVRRMARAGVPLGGPTPPAVALAPAPQPPGSLAARQPAAQSRASSTPGTALATGAPATATPEQPATPPAAGEIGAWTLEPDQGVTPAAAELAPDGTRSVLSAGGDPASQRPRQPAATPAPSGPAVTQPPVELLPTPAAK